MSNDSKETGKAGDENATEDATFDPSDAALLTDDAGEADNAASGSQRTTFFIACLALFAAVLALLVFGVDRLTADPVVAAGPAPVIDTTAIDAVEGNVNQMRSALQTLQQQVSSLADELAARERAITTIDQRFADRLRQIDGVSARLSATENALSSLQGISVGARDAWLLAEAEYYLQIANAQAQLAGNPQLAALALGLADERLLQLGNPALTNVRRALSRELQSLELLEAPDTTGAALTLASLAEAVDALPLRQEITPTAVAEGTIDPELTGTDRALASLQNAMSKAVSVRRVDEAARPFIAPEAQYFLRANLALQLQAARLAMLRGEPPLFEQSLDDAARWLNDHYDTDSTPVQSALQTIADIRSSGRAVALPDISESLALLRQFNALAEATSRPVPDDENTAEPQQ